ncbi:MAG TPA: threonine/serine dehydratase [Gemmatimonadaceae bacterium]|nr:threonine/serine dehydratase [Gemmatimonadaceae bacterium]
MDVSPLVPLDRVRQAAQAFAGRLHRTPTVPSRHLSHVAGANVLLKLELFQKTGSFKPRGVLTALDALPEAERRKGVITLSAGNHAQAVAWAASASGIRSTVVMPAHAVRFKVEATREYGGEVILTHDDLLATTLEIQKRRGLTLVHPFDHPDIIAGQGTVALELLEDVPAVDAVLVGCGGGGLLAGVATVVKALRPAAKVYGVEPSGAPGMRQSLDRGAPVRLDRVDTIADGLAAPFIGALTFAHARALVDDVFVVEDAEIVTAMKTLMQRIKVLAEPAGAAALAPLLAGRVPLHAGATVAVVVSGGNVDLDRLRGLL